MGERAPTHASHTPAPTPSLEREGNFEGHPSRKREGDE